MKKNWDVQFERKYNFPITLLACQNIHILYKIRYTRHTTESECNNEF